MRLFYIPVGTTSDAMKHLNDTIVNAVRLTNIQSFLESTVFETISSAGITESVKLWGVVKGKSNETFYNAVEKGDIILFYRNGKFIYYGEVVIKTVNPQLSRYIWGGRQDDNTWQNIFVLTNVREIDISRQEFAELFGYKKNFVPQRFAYVKDAENKVSNLGGVSNVIVLLDKKSKKQDSEISYEDIGFTDDDAGFPEGKQILRTHLTRERNPEVIRIAKHQFKEKHGKLFCQVCKFDFKVRYGSLGEDYIEGHHTGPVSELVEGQETKIEDIAIVCSNCHRMLHRRRPWLTMEQLQDLIQKHK